MINFKIVTPEGVVYEDDIVKVTIPTGDGQITVLADHVPIVSTLEAGELLVHKQDGTMIALACSGGIVEVREGSKVYIMADTAERAEDIDLERAEAARARAEELLKQQKDLGDVDFARIQAMIEKEIVRLGVGRKYRK